MKDKHKSLKEKLAEAYASGRIKMSTPEERDNNLAIRRARESAAFAKIAGAAVKKGIPLASDH